jgi:hypothetical protein
MDFHPVAVVLQQDTAHKQHTSHKIAQLSNETQYTKLTHNKHPTQNVEVQNLDSNVVVTK